MGQGGMNGGCVDYVNIYNWIMNKYKEIQMDDKEHSTSVSAVDQWIEIISTPELKTSLYYALLLTISVIFQLLADTFISRIVGKYGGDYATARGIIINIIIIIITIVLIIIIILSLS